MSQPHYFSLGWNSWFLTKPTKTRKSPKKHGPVGFFQKNPGFSNPVLIGVEGNWCRWCQALVPNVVVRWQHATGHWPFEINLRVKTTVNTVLKAQSTSWKFSISDIFRYFSWPIRRLWLINIINTKLPL